MWEKNLQESGYMYNWFTLWYSWNNIVNQLYSNLKKKQALSFYVIFIILRYLSYLSILVFAWDTNKTNTTIRNWQNESLYLMVWISWNLVHSKSLCLAWLPQSDFSHCGLLLKNLWKVTVCGWRGCRGVGENLNFNQIFISCTPLGKGVDLNIRKSTSIKWG